MKEESAPGQGGAEGGHRSKNRVLNIDRPRGKSNAGERHRIAADAVADLRFRRQVEHLHGLGARAMAELLGEIGEQRLCRTFIEQRLRRYASLDPQAIKEAGGDRFPRPPIHEVQL